MSREWQRLSAVPPERRIYIDLDDVLAETTRHIVDLLNARFARSVAFHELDDFDLGRCFDLDPEQHAHAMRCVHEEPFLLGLPVREGAQDVLRTWAASGYHLAVITGRPPETHEVSCDWLRTHDVPHHSIHCIDKYGRYGAHSEHTSLDLLRAFPFEIAIEDSPEMARFLVEHSGGTVLLMDRPWNRAHPLLEGDSTDRILRVHTWSEIATELRTRAPRASARL